MGLAIRLHVRLFLRIHVRLEIPSELIILRPVMGFVVGPVVGFIVGDVFLAAELLALASLGGEPLGAPISLPFAADDRGRRGKCTRQRRHDE